MVWWAGPRHHPDGLTGGSQFGLWCGVLGSVCMVLAGLLPLLRRRALLLPRRLPSRAFWLQGHIWIGLLSLVFIGFHSGWRLAGTLVTVLTLVYLVVIGSGIVGLVVQAVLPHRLTTASRHEVPPDQIASVCAAWRAEADDLVDRIAGAVPLCALASRGPAEADSSGEVSLARSLRGLYHRKIRPGLYEAAPWGWPAGGIARLEADLARLRHEARSPTEEAALDRLAAICRERFELLGQQWRFWWLHAWLPVHIGLSAALLVLGVAHAVTALWY